MYLLLIDDDEQAAESLQQRLTDNGHCCEYVNNTTEGLQRALTDAYDIVIVVRKLPAPEGLSFVFQLRKQQQDIPILIISALTDIDDCIEGLNAGGHDYRIQPYAFRELLARLEALHRRAPGRILEHSLKVADLELDLLSRTVKRNGKSIRLQPRELSMLEYLMGNRGRTVTRTMLLEKVWGFHFDPHTNVIDTQVSRLRAKIDRGFELALLHTVRGAG